MKKIYEAPSVEKIAFNYRDQVVAASGEQSSGTNTGSNVFESNEFGNCYDLGDVGQYLLNSWIGDCAWINRA